MTYEEAIKWIEDEIFLNGVFEAKLDEVEIMERHVPVMDVNGVVTIAERAHKMAPTGRLVGFTCSSQHTSGRAHNLLQLIMEMKEISDKRTTENLKNVITCS